MSVPEIIMVVVGWCAKVVTVHYCLGGVENGKVQDSKTGGKLIHKNGMWYLAKTGALADKLTDDGEENQAEGEENAQRRWK